MLCLRSDSILVHRFRWPYFWFKLCLHESCIRMRSITPLRECFFEYAQIYALETEIAVLGSALSQHSYTSTRIKADLMNAMCYFVKSEKRRKTKSTMQTYTCDASVQITIRKLINFNKTQSIVCRQSKFGLCANAYRHTTASALVDLFCLSGRSETNEPFLFD